jgi:hypothetical protein
MFPKHQIDGFEKYWRRRKPGSSTALHYASDIRIFFRWAGGQPPEAITVHDVDEFIGCNRKWMHASCSSITARNARIGW